MGNRAFSFRFYSRARLVLVMEDEGTGEASYYNYDNESTMADEGAYPYAHFFIEFEDKDKD